MVTVAAGNVIGFLVALPMALPVAAPGTGNLNGIPGTCHTNPELAK
jgi:hypothetical protein